MPRPAGGTVEKVGAFQPQVHGKLLIVFKMLNVLIKISTDLKYEDKGFFSQEIFFFTILLTDFILIVE